ncbi:MAG: hypothetical protein SFY68_00135 [Candidatus Sumerlaeia bacterium]|nr:hypothetical protein [Candidatus Sumerlaeia bacterium]
MLKLRNEPRRMPLDLFRPYMTGDDRWFPSNAFIHFTCYQCSSCWSTSAYWLELKSRVPKAPAAGEE